MQNELLQVGGAVALIALTVRELFAYLKSKGATDSSMSENIFNELKKMNSNHLSHIQGAIEDGNKELTRSMHDDNIKIIELLAEIKGSLNSRR